MSSLSALFGNSQSRSSTEDERLLDLYWNRNELKKEFAGLRTEKFKLTDRIKTQKGDIERLKQKLEHLEHLLVEPEWGRSVFVMYQLRGLGTRCTNKIGRFAEQIKRQQEQKLHGEAVSRWRASIEADASAVRTEILELEEHSQAARDEIGQLESQFQSMGRIMRFVRRANFRRRIERLGNDIGMLSERIAERQQAVVDIENREPPEMAGLSLMAKRSINFTILAYAQQLYISFDDDDLAGLVKEACDKSAGAVRYGTEAECEEIVARVRRAEGRLARGRDFAAEIQKRARLISEGAAYGDDEDAVPLPDTVSTLFRFDNLGNVETTVANLLGQNYWGLATVMSR